jgi:hypothetical protein
MRPTRLAPPGTGRIEDFDGPAYTRALTPLPEIQRRLAADAADRQVVSNRAFNLRFWATVSSETGGVPSGMLTARLGRLVSRVLGRAQPPRDAA